MVTIILIAVTCLVSILCFTGTLNANKLGIVKYHFEIGAGKENFEWR